MLIHINKNVKLCNKVMFNSLNVNTPFISVKELTINRRNYKHENLESYKNLQKLTIKYLEVKRNFSALKWLKYLFIGADHVSSNNPSYHIILPEGLEHFESSTSLSHQTVKYPSSIRIIKGKFSLRSTTIIHCEHLEHLCIHYLKYDFNFRADFDKLKSLIVNEIDEHYNKWLPETLENLFVMIWDEKINLPSTIKRLGLIDLKNINRFIIPEDIDELFIYVEKLDPTVELPKKYHVIHCENSREELESFIPRFNKLY